MRTGDTVEILKGPRTGEQGVIALMADNGAFVEMSDGKYHSVTCKNIKFVRRVRNKEKQDQHPNFRSKEGKLYLVRCFVCGGKYGKENYLPAVASGICAWCGWEEK